MQHETVRLLQASVVMPVHAKASRLELALAALAALEPRPSHELILVADNASPEVMRIATRGGPWRLIETPGLGRAGARNRGAQAARAELLVFLDDDVLVRPDFIRQHLLAQARGPGLVHGRLREIIGLLRSDDPAQGGAACPPIPAQALRDATWNPGRAMRLSASTLEQAAEDPHVFSRAPWLASAGANLSLPRVLWERIGGFDEGYGLRWGLEDLDFGFRLWRAGVGIQVAAAAIGLHMSHQSATRWTDQQLNFERFFAIAHDCPEAHALTELLSPVGSLAAYKVRLDQIAQEA
jgi:GT2 family glycosyltransferase